MKRFVNVLKLSVLVFGAMFLGKAYSIETDLVGEERARLKPRCDVVVLNGVVAESLDALENYKASKQKASLLERYPLQCNRHVCMGMAALKNVRAQVENWTQNYIYVTVPLNFDTGKRVVYLWVPRQSTSCPYGSR